jgi:hypothetical protein
VKMDKLLKVYLELERRVFVLRQQHGESLVEDRYMDAMEVIWWELPDEQRVLIDSRDRAKKGTGSI